jgi:hypothetical protein
LHDSLGLTLTAQKREGAAQQEFEAAKKLQEAEAAKEAKGKSEKASNQPNK